MELVCPNESPKDNAMWDRVKLHAMEDDGKMDEDKREPGDEEDADEEQEEEHQKARAIASPDFPSRREVEEHNLTHIPFRSQCNHCMRGRTEERTHKEARRRRRSGRQSSSQWTALYLTEEDTAEEGNTGRGHRQRKHDIGASDHRGRGEEDCWSPRTPSEMQGQWRPMDCDKNCGRH